MNKKTWIALTSSLLVLLGSLIGGCGSGSHTEPEWTVDEGGLALDRTLLISETDSFYFGDVGDVAVDGDGHAYVLDRDAQHITVIGPEGGIQDSLGSEGQGPGEFQGARDVVVGRGDSLYVLDPRSSRISVFDPAGRFVYDVQVEYQGVADDLMVPDNHPGFLLSNTSFPPPDASTGGSFSILRVTPNGSITDTLLTAPPLETEVIQQGENRLFLSVPYGRQPHVALGPQGRVYFGRNDSLRVIAHSFDGSRTTPIRLPFELVSLSDEERTERLKRYPDKNRSQIQDAVPATKPAFEHFLVDDEGRYWFGRPTEHPDSTAWWMAMPQEKQVRTSTLPSEVDILAVKDGNAYGRTTTEAGAPALVRYHVQSSE